MENICQHIRLSKGYDRAIDAGCESVMKPEKLERWPVTVAFVKDFDGYLIEFVEHHEGTRQECQIQRKLDLTQGKVIR